MTDSAERVILDRIRRRTARLVRLLDIDAPEVLAEAERRLVARAVVQWIELVNPPPPVTPNLN